MSTPSCNVCGRWNDPTGGPEAHSGGCPNTGQPYRVPGDGPYAQGRERSCSCCSERECVCDGRTACCSN